LGHKVSHEGINFELGTDIDPAGWFVENENVALARKPFGENKFLLISSRKARGGPI
jgi:hypothetical protein